MARRKPALLRRARLADAVVRVRALDEVRVVVMQVRADLDEAGEDPEAKRRRRVQRAGLARRDGEADENRREGRRERVRTGREEEHLPGRRARLLLSVNGGHVAPRLTWLALV